MSTEPTSALTFQDLILEVAIKAGLAYYGANGTEAAQIPVDPHDLAECKRHVNNAMRMFMADSPVAGWRWARPTQSFVLWVSVVAEAGKTVTAGAYDSANNQTLLTANSAVFFSTMEDKTIVVKDVETFPGTFEDQSFRIKQYLTSTTVYVTGDASAALGAHQYSIDSNSDYTLPRNFGGPHGGPITFAEDTNQTTMIEWGDENEIRDLRTITAQTTGFPTLAATKLAETVQPGDRRRYELAVYPRPYQQFTVQFKYNVHFDKFVELTEHPPSPVIHDETLRAACRAVVERDVDRIVDGPDWQYYSGNRLPASKAADSRSGPRRLGYFGNPSGAHPKQGRYPPRRPDVTFDTGTP